MRKSFLVLLFSLFVHAAFAGVPCTLPFTLTNGTLADATQVMANYNALITCLGSAAAAGANSDITSISGLTTPLAPPEGGTPVFIGATSTGSGNAQTVTVTSPGSFALVGNYQVLFKAGFTNTGPATLNVAGTGVIAMNKQTIVGLQALIGGEIVTGQIYAANYDGSVWQILNPTASSSILAPTAISSQYTVATSDCGKVLSLGGNTFYKVTFNAPSGYSSGCIVTLIDKDVARGKGIAVSGLASVRLFPLQTMTVTQDAGTWVVSPQNQFWYNPGTFYLSNLGSDDPLSTDCLATGVAGCLTANNLTGSNGIFQTYIHATAGGVTIQADCNSNYTEAILTIARTREQIISFVGNASNPLACPWILPGAGTIFDVQDGAQVTITGFELGHTAGSGTLVSGRQIVILDVNNIYFASNAGNYHVTASDLASVNLTSIILNGSAAGLVNAGNKSVVQVNGVTIPGGGTATLTNWFVAADAEIAGTPAYSVAGVVAGAQFSCSSNAVISLGTAYPGALTAGSATSGCQANPPGFVVGTSCGPGSPTASFTVKNGFVTVC